MDEAIRLNVVMYVTTLLGTGTVGTDDDGKTWFVYWEGNPDGYTAVIVRNGHVDIFENFFEIAPLYQIIGYCAFNHIPYEIVH